MKPIISIVGPTAVGKTEAALLLAQQYLDDGVSQVHLISADSRQVYKGIEILTGADVPNGFEYRASKSFAYPYYQKGAIYLHGIGIVAPTEDWSVAHFQELSLPIISTATEHTYAVIIVGGTGLYHDHLFSADPQLQVPPNSEVRAKAASLSVEELQSWLEKINPVWLQKLNNSDKRNPRRLVRAIEISLVAPAEKSVHTNHSIQHKYIGLFAPSEILEERISARVITRFSSALSEVTVLVNTYQSLAKQARTTMGFKELLVFEQTDGSKDAVIEKWTLREFQYAKRQLTWWKKRSEVQWVDTAQPDWQTELTAITKSARY